MSSRFLIVFASALFMIGISGQIALAQDAGSTPSAWTAWWNGLNAAPGTGDPALAAAVEIMPLDNIKPAKKTSALAAKKPVNMKTFKSKSAKTDTKRRPYWFEIYAAASRTGAKTGGETTEATGTAPAPKPEIKAATKSQKPKKNMKQWVSKPANTADATPTAPAARPNPFAAFAMTPAPQKTFAPTAQTTGLTIASAMPLVGTPIAQPPEKARKKINMKSMKTWVSRVETRKPRRPIVRGVDPKFARTEVEYKTEHKAGTVVVDANSRFLYLVQPDGKAIRYGVGVGRLGFTWKGTARINHKKEWPAWHPPASMRKREPWLPARMEGGPENPLGARALYLFQGGKDTLYRIHGTNQPGTIGQAVSSGCIRLLNDDIEDLYERVPRGAKVVVL